MTDQVTSAYAPVNYSGWKACSAAKPQPEHESEGRENQDVIVTLTPRAVGSLGGRERCMKVLPWLLEKKGSAYKENLPIIDGFTARVDADTEKWLEDQGFVVTRDNKVRFYSPLV